MSWGVCQARLEHELSKAEVDREQAVLARDSALEENAELKSQLGQLVAAAQGDAAQALVRCREM